MGMSVPPATEASGALGAKPAKPSKPAKAPWVAGVLAATAAAVLLAGCGSGQPAPQMPSGTLSPGIPKSLLWQPDPAKGWLSGIATATAGTGWAVGVTCGEQSCAGDGSESEQAMILRWNGTRWDLSASAGPTGPSTVLNGVTAGPHGTAWAVGNVCAANCGTGTQTFQTLIFRWDGSSWAETPSPGGNARLYAVTANPDGTAWAVGFQCTAHCGTTAESDAALILHWNGTAWSVAADAGLTNAYLLDVSSGPAGTAWAAGYRCTANCGTTAETDETLILHWNGHHWSRATAPSPGTAAGLAGIAAAPDGTAWAVGDSCATGCGNAEHPISTLILHWNGHTWTRTASPSPALAAGLNGVSAGPNGTAWAVGHSCVNCHTAAEDDRLLILRWDGHAWTQTPFPSPERMVQLSNVASAPNGSAWAVGQSCTAQCGTATQQLQPLILRWNGQAWRVTTP